MTPFARNLIEKAKHKNLLDKPFFERLLKAKCYEITEVVELVKETSKSFSNRQRNQINAYDNLDIKDFNLEDFEELEKKIDNKDILVDHGGLLFMPDEFVWLEYKNENHFQGMPQNIRIGILCCKYEDQISFTALSSDFYLNGLPSFVTLREDDKFELSSDVRLNQVAEDTPENRKLTISMGLSAISALVILNAPYGIEKIEHHAHKGFAKTLTRNGLPKPKPYTVISLSKHVRPDQIVGSGTGSPKAFHFVRSHLRNYETGKQSKVKAHWRGDPALGILKTDYKVVP